MADNGVIEWWKTPERPMTDREKRMSELRAAAERSAPIVRAPLEQRYAGVAGPEDNPNYRPRHERFDNQVK
jgi:hypothetical protein